MKVKIMLLVLVATVGSAALVASAQTPTSFVVTSGSSGDPQVSVASPAARRWWCRTSRAGGPDGVRRSARTFFSPRPNQFFYTTEDNPLSHQAEQLAQQLAAAKSDSDREKIKGQLAETLEKQFDQRQKRHEEEIKSLEAQVKKLKDLVDKRQENRREIIARRLNQIVKESQGLGW